jgi:hypothetical protein
MPAKKKVQKKKKTTTKKKKVTKKKVVKKTIVKKKSSKKKATPKKKSKGSGKPGRPIEITDERILEALDKNYGFMCRAAKALGCTRQTIFLRLKNNPDLKSAYSNQQETNIEELIASEFESARDGNMTARHFLLNAKGKKYGFGIISTHSLNQDMNSMSDEEGLSWEDIIMGGTNPDGSYRMEDEPTTPKRKAAASKKKKDKKKLKSHDDEEGGGVDFGL